MIRLTEAQAAALMSGKKQRKAKTKKRELVEPAYRLGNGTRDSPVTLTIPVEIVSEANERGHWRKSAGRKSSQKKIIQKALARNIYGLIFFVNHLNNDRPIHVRLTRLAPCQIDFANLVSGLKIPEDSCAEWCGCNDRPPLWLCEFAQEKSPKYGLKVEIWT